MKKLGTFLLSSMLLLMNSCSETSSPGLEWLGDEVAVRFTTTMNPSVEILPTRAMIHKLPTEEGKNQVGIYGLLTGSKNREESETFKWEVGTNVNFHQEMVNKQYLLNEGNTLSPANGKVDYHPSRGTSALAVYAYWPYNSEIDDDGYIPVNIEAQQDLLYTGKVLSIVNEETNSFDPVELTFKHAMGAIAFRFYTEDPNLKGTPLQSIELFTSYSIKDVKLNLATGECEGDNNGDLYTVQLDCKIGTEDTAPICGHTMLPAGEGLVITGIKLWYNAKEYVSCDLQHDPIELIAGKTKVLNIICTKKAGTTPQLIVDKTGNASSELPPL